MTLKQLNFFFNLKSIFSCANYYARKKKFFLCAKDDLLCAIVIFPKNKYKKN